MDLTKYTDANKSSSVIASFTKDQLNAYTHLIDFINRGFDENDYRRALIGSAGTGKTYMIKEVINKCNLSNSTIGLAAPTHKAARVLSNSTNIKTSTIASDLGFRLNTDLEDFDINNPPFDPLGEKKIKGYRLYIIDEASMIGRSLKTYIEKECKKNGCMIIYMGDSSQLPPVKETISPCLRGIKYYELNQIVRQEEDNPVSYLLKLLRYDIQHKTWKFLEHINANRFKFDLSESKGYYTCGLNEFQSLIIDGFNNEEFTTNVDTCRLVAYTNKAVSDWNKFIRTNIIQDSDRAALTRNDLILSYVTLVNEFNEAVITNSEDYIIKNIANFTNKDGIKGFTVKFVKINGGESTKPLFVVDHNDRANILLYYKLCNKFIDAAKSAPASSRRAHWKLYYEFKERNLLLANILDKYGKIKFYRDLDYGFAITSHKAQGSTFKDVYVDINDIVFMANGSPYGDIDNTLRRLYTACSRCKNRLFLCYGW